MSTWGPEAAERFRAYVLDHAVNANASIERVADLARESQIKPGVFSKWFSGSEQPSVRLLKQLSPVIKAPLSELLVLAGRVDPADFDFVEAPEPPGVLTHPLARELDTMLGDESPLTEQERQSIATFLDQYLATYRRRRPRGGRRSA